MALNINRKVLLNISKKLTLKLSEYVKPEDVDRQLITALAILKRLEGRQDHPSAEMLYKELRATFPTISFATIYGTAELLAQAGLISILTIDERHVIFDPNATPHGHFRCTKCHRVEDILLPENALSSLWKDIPHRIREVQVFLYGTCPVCLASASECSGNA